MTLVVRSREKSRENSLENSLECARACEGFLCGQADQALSCCTTMFGMKEAGTALVAAPPPGPGEQQCRTARRWPEQMCEQMAYFGNGERKEGTGRRCSFSLGRLSGEYASRSTNACKTCLDDHDERYVPVPTMVATHFVILQAHFFPCLETFFNAPSRSDRLDHLGKRGAHWGKDEVVGFFARIVETTANQQEVSSIILPPMEHGHQRPIEPSWSLGAVTHRDPLPIIGVKRECLGLGHRHAFAALCGRYPHGFIAGNGQHVGVLMRFQPEAEVQIPSIDGISDHPGKRNLCVPQTLDHLSGQFAFGRKASGIRNACFPTAFAILDPAQREVQFPIEQCVAEAADVGEKHPDLTIFELARRSAILFRHSCRFLAAFTKARFVDHQDRLGITQLLQDVGTQIVAHQIGVPGCAVQQPLHTVRSGFSGVFSQLPAIFTRGGTHDALQVGQCPTTRFRSSKTRGDAGIQAFEFLPPLPDFGKGGFRPHRGDLLGLLHVLFLPHGRARCHIPPERAIEAESSFFWRAVSFSSPLLALTPIVPYTAPEIDLVTQEKHTMESKDTNTTATTEPPPRDIVCIYSQADEPFYLQLKKSLNLWERHGQVRWLEVLAGEEPATTWQHDVQCADLILFLLSSDFFADELCYHIMHLALQERASRQVPVVPILVRAVNWRLSACKDLAIVPHNERPVASWTLPDEAYASIGADLLHLVPAWQIELNALSTRPRLFQAHDLPKGYVPRPKAFDAIKYHLLNRQGKQTTAITTALRGAGGFGKTTLALALCHDVEIQAAFPDGILWVELGEHPPRLLDVLNGLLASLDASLSRAITLEEARDRWHTTMERRVCLLVIDDVWQATALSPLLEGGPQCVRLVTTRNDQVLPEEAERIWVDAMEPEEALAVLCRALPVEIEQPICRARLATLAERLGYWPLLLTLAHGLLADHVRYGRTLAKALEVVERAYQDRGVTAFRLDNEAARNQTAQACLEVSLRHLEDFMPTHIQARERYHEFAVFPEDTEIPLTMIQRFWHATGGLEPWETDDVCIRLHRLSLLLSCDLGKGAMRLHDVMRSYLLQRAGPHLPALHARFLDVSQEVLGLKRWADLPSDEHYLWQHLVLHLCSAERTEEFQTTLTDLGYLINKALYIGVSALEADLLLAIQHTDAVPPALSLFESLHRTIVRISHLLRQLSTPAEMGGLLLSHLGSQPLFATQRLALERELPRPFLTAWHPLPGASSALLRTLSGHIRAVNGCAVSPDGKWIVSASHDGTLKVWDAATGAERLSLSGHGEAVLGCAVSPDGQWIVSASWDHTLKIWNAATGAERRTLSGHTSAVTGCAVSPDGRWIVSASWDHTLKIWDAATGAERRTLSGHTGYVRGCAVSPDGRFIVSAADDHTLKIWDAATGAERRTLSGHTWTVIGCAVSPDGRFIVSASGDKTLKIWDAATGAERRTLINHTEWVNGCAVSPDGRFIVSASHDSTLKVWDTATGAGCISLTDHTEWVNGCAVSPDGRFIVSTSEDKTLKVWDAATGVERLSLTGHTGLVSGCAVSPDGRFIVSAADDGRLMIWDAATGAGRLSLSGHTGPVRGCAVSPDSRFIVSASGDKALKIWDAATGAERLSLSGHGEAVWGCAVSPDGRFIVSAADDHTLKIWDAATGAERRTLSGHTGYVRGCAVSPDSRFIVSASADHTLKVWDGRTGHCVLTFPVDGELFGCVFHPDGEHLVACGQLGVYFLRLVV